MTQECTLVEEWGIPTSYTVANGTTIEKGAVCKIADPATASLADGDGDPCAGIAAAEKIASNGQTKLAFHTTGKWIGTAGATGVTAGQAIMTYNGTGDDNDLVVCAAGEDNIVGYALETAASNETFLFILAPANRDIA